jgi:hypothetical protein
MGSFGLPALAIKPPEPNDPLQQVGKLAQLQGALQERQTGQIQLQQQKQALQDQQAATAAMHDWDGKDFQQLPSLMLKHGASATAVIGMKQHILTQQETLSKMAQQDAETGSKNVATTAAKNNLALGQLQTLNDVPDEQLGSQLTKVSGDLANAGLIDPQHAQAAQQLAQLPPPQLRKALALYEKSMMGQKEQFDQAAKQLETNATVYKNTMQGNEANVASQQKQLTLAGTSPTGVTAEQQLQAGQKAQDLKLRGQEVRISGGRLAEEQRHNKMQEGGPVSNIPAGVSGDDALKLMDPQRAAAVKMIGDGKVDFATMAARMPPAARINLAADVNKYNPDFSQQTYSITKGMGKYMTSGEGGKNLTNFNTAIDHAKQLDKAVDALNNGDIRALNSIGNQAGYQFGSDKTTNFNVIKNALSGEVSKVFKGGQATDAEIHAVQAPFDAANSPQQLKGAIKQAIYLMNSKRDALKQQYESGEKGKPNFGESSSPATAAPMSATGPNGHKIIVQGGRWVDAQTGAPVQ